MFCHVRLCLGAAVLLAAAFPAKGFCQTSAAPIKSTAELHVFDPTLVDKSVDPCDNFYRYSCNGWLKQNPLPPDQSSYDRATVVEEATRLHLRAILEQASNAASTRTPNEQKIGDEYATCMDAAAIDKAGIAPLQPELDRIAALQSISDLAPLLGRLHQIGVNAFFGISGEQDLENASNVISMYGAGGLGLPERDYYTRMDPTSVEQRKQYVLHVEKMLQLIGESEAQAKSDAATVLAIEMRLAKASLTVTEQRDPKNLDHPIDIAVFGRELSHFSLHDYVAAVHAPASGRTNVSEPKFLVEFNAMLSDTPLDQIKVYLRWRLLDSLAGTSLPESLDYENWHFYDHILNGVETQKERWKRCTSRIDDELGEAMGQVYVNRYFKPEAKQRTLEMVLAIEQAMDKDIDALDWMSAETKARAKEKLHTVMNKIGYPDHWRDYTSLQIVRGDALGNQERAREFELARLLAKIGKPVDKGEWMMTPQTVNAYYFPTQNNINFPAGYLQPPFFSETEDDAANFGDLGSTIGHELTHGFDDQGRQFDKDGNLKEWWTADDEKKFNDRAACEVAQYDAIEAVPGVHLNGKLTLGENLADLGGLRIAWMAWQDQAQGKHVDMNVKTDGYTPDQRFWIAYGQAWCQQTRPEQLRTQAQTNPHSPEEDRTNAVLQDLPAFARSFSCKKTDKMVNPDPCRVW